MEWISHRGLCENAIENTRQSFDQAIAAGFVSLETDLRITEDHQIVLCHDQTLKRICGLDINVLLSQKSELQKVRLPFESQLMFFEDLLLHYLNFQWTLEIKPEQGMRTIQKLIEIVDREKLEDWILKNVKFLVAHPAHEQALKLRFPNARFYAAYSECRKVGFALLLGLASALTIDPNKTYGIPPRFWGIDLCRKNFINFFHHRGARVLAFLPKNDEEALAAASIGFDEILTDGRIVRLSASSSKR